MNVTLHPGPQVVINLDSFRKEDIVEFGKYFHPNGDIFEWEIFYSDDEDCFVLNIYYKEGSWYAEESWTFKIYPPTKPVRVECYHFYSDGYTVWRNQRILNEYANVDYSNVIFF